MRSNSASAASGYAIAARFRDFDQFRETIGGWDLDFRQMDRGPFEASLTQVASPGVILTRCGLSRKVEQCGAPPAGYLTFGIPADDEIDVRWRGRDLKGHHLMCFPSGGELDSISKPGFDVFTISISHYLIQKVAVRRGVSSVEELIPRMDVIDYSPELRRALRRKAAVLAASAGCRPELLSSSSFIDDLEHDLVECLLDCIGAGQPVRSRAMARRRSQVLKISLDAIAECGHEPITVAELQQLSGASVRTLRYAFGEAFDLSPKQYLQNYRLNKVRRLLWRSAEAGCVSDAANAWGFWHMGQFAADYRRLFGELPGETFARARGA